MEMTTLKTAIAYEIKLVKRSWLFNLFVFGALGYIVGDSFLDNFVMKYISWDKFIFASSFPLHGFYFLNLFQSVIVVFIACDIQRKRKKAETREVLYAWPIGNGQAFVGEFLGIFIPFAVIDMLFLCVSMSINLFIPNSPVNLWVNLFIYLLTCCPRLFLSPGYPCF